MGSIFSGISPTAHPPVDIIAWHDRDCVWPMSKTTELCLEYDMGDGYEKKKKSQHIKIRRYLSVASVSRSYL